MDGLLGLVVGGFVVWAIVSAADSAEFRREHPGMSRLERKYWKKAQRDNERIARRYRNSNPYGSSGAGLGVGGGDGDGGGGGD